MGAETRTWESADLWGELPETAAVVKGENLFPRLDLDKALAELEAAEAAAKKQSSPTWRWSLSSREGWTSTPSARATSGL